VGKKSKSEAKTADAGPAGTTYEVKFGIIKAIGNSDPVIIIDP
jgi:hypothetical protein